MKRNLVGDDSLETVLDTVLIPVLVMDSDVRLLGYNLASVPLFEKEKNIVGMRCGDALHCINSMETPEGCGEGELCKKCVIRNSVKQCYGGSKVEKMQTQMHLMTGAEVKQIQMSVTTTLLKYCGESFVLVILEDIAELFELKGLIPICSYCKKIRDDKTYWQNVETFLARNLKVMCSHTICPDCIKEHYPDLHARKEE